MLSHPSTLRRGPRLGLLLLPLLLVGVPSVEAQAVELRWRLATGETLHYRQSQSTVNASPMGEITQQQTTVMSQEVLRVVDDGTAALRVRYESVRSVQDGPMGRQEFDSEVDDEPGDPGMAVGAALVGQGFEMTMGPRGEILDVSGLDTLLETMMDALPPEAGAGEQVREALEASFGEEQMSAMMQQGVHVLPDEPVSPGDEWTQELLLPLAFGTVRSAYHYRLEEVVSEGGRTIAQISMTGTIGEFEADESNPMASMMSLSGGDLRGEIAFDVDRGRLLRASASTEMTIAAMGQSIGITTDQEMELLDG